MLAPFSVLFEADGVPAYQMPAELERLYGRLGFSSPAVYANFVESLDGVVALGSLPSAGSVISGKNPADRFLMGLLRACADAVLIGAGTLRATPGHLWTPAYVYPEMAPAFAELRHTLGREAEPRLVVVTASGDLDASHPALVKGAVVVTTPAGARAIGRKLPPSCEVTMLGAGDRLDARLTVDELRRRGWGVVLTEGGPHLVGQLVQAGLLDELFLTLSPALAGRGSETRLGMVEGVELLPSAGAWTSLVSARRHGDFMFLRYGLQPRRTR